MKLVDTSISLAELTEMSHKMFNKLVKGVVDVQKEIMVVDAPFHADQEYFLLEHDSQQGDLWGINIHPAKEGDAWIEFDSIINLRPSWGNISRGVDDPKMQAKIRSIVNALVTK
jgi:hypothetical protein